jgi:hypothetical protein
MTSGNRFQGAWTGRFAVLLGLGVAGLLMTASQAAANCVGPGRPGSAPVSLLSPGLALAPLGQGNGNGGGPSTIVGLWHVVYTATAATSGPIPVPVIPPGPPDSFQFIESMKTWHADGTEWEEKIQPAPAGFCFGVWAHGPRDTVRLHHFGALTAPDGSVTGIFWMDEVDRVAADGRTYTGTWVFRLFGPSDVLGTGPLLQQISGTMEAARITVN